MNDPGKGDTQMSSRGRSFVVDSNGRSIDFYCTVNGCKVVNTNLRIDGLVEQAREPDLQMARPSPILECRLDAPPADPRKGPIGRTFGTLGDVPAPGIRSDRID
jgi:hypothetical protein